MNEQMNECANEEMRGRLHINKTAEFVSNKTVQQHSKEKNKI